MIDGSKSIEISSTSPATDSQQHQETIYNFFIKIVREGSPEKAILEFQRLFFNLDEDTYNSGAIRALTEIIFNQDEHAFLDILKRCCYILINNWESARQYAHIKELIRSLEDTKSTKPSLSRPLNRMRGWVNNFTQHSDFNELKIFAARHEATQNNSWSSRYTAFLLVPQYTNANNSIEQREAAQSLARQLKDRFKFDLAMYTARSQLAIPRSNQPNNPTALGDEVLRLVKRIVLQARAHKKHDLGRLFLMQVKGLYYSHFKTAFQQYLIFSIKQDRSVDKFRDKLSQKLDQLLPEKNNEVLNNSLLLRTANRVIDYLTTEERGKPSDLFVLFLSQGNTITLVMILLKITLASPLSRIHLEEKIAQLIQFYIDQNADDNQSVINFFEVFRVAYAICGDDVEYSLVKVAADDNASLENYRLFSQQKDAGELIAAQDEQVVFNPQSFSPSED